jgi:hypothetical protein
MKSRGWLALYRGDYEKAAELFQEELTTAPEDNPINLPFGGTTLPFTLRKARLEASFMATAGQVSGADGTLCGCLSTRGLSSYTFPLGNAPACDGRGDSPSLLDVLAGGATLMGFPVGPALPDVDIDGDGLETFQIQREGPSGCQPVIVACFDGDGTRIDGASCTVGRPWCRADGCPRCCPARDTSRCSAPTRRWKCPGARPRT